MVGTERTLVSHAVGLVEAHTSLLAGSTGGQGPQETSAVSCEAAGLGTARFALADNQGGDPVIYLFKVNCEVVTS